MGYTLLVTVVYVAIGCLVYMTTEPRVRRPPDFTPVLPPGHSTC